MKQRQKLLARAQRVVLEIGVGGLNLPFYYAGKVERVVGLPLP